MPTLSLARPIDNIDDADEARVLALLAHLMPMLDDWRSGEDLRRSIEGMRQTLTGQRALLGAVQQSLQQARDAEAAVMSSPASYGIAPIVTGISALLFGILIAVFVSLLFGAMLAFAGLLVAGALGWRRASAIRDQRIEASLFAERAVAAASDAVDETSARLRRFEQELSRREVGFPSVRLADLRFGLGGAEVLGHPVLLDLSGTHPSTTLMAVDVSELEAGVSRIAGKVDALLSVPPLLSPGETLPDGDPVHQLYGEEDALQRLVGEFSVNLGRLRNVTLPLPMVPATSLLAQRLDAGALHVAADVPAIVLTSAAVAPEQIRHFVDEVNQSRARGQRVFEELGAVYGNLEQACRLYHQARTESIDMIHRHLLDVLGRAAWCNRRLYCPRSILAPQYIQDLLGIDLQRAYLLSLDDLLDGLQGDPEITRRLQDKPELQADLIAGYEAVQVFMGDVSFDQDGNRIDQGGRARHVEAQFQESVKRFRHILQRVMTGADYPVLNFSAEAQLYYDPDTDQWHSDTAPHVYDTATAMRFGSVVRAYSDLMLPLWGHLWAEKADFRRNELFRTNEAILRMTEKESEKLIDVANQFRADMRSVRENLYLIESELTSKQSEIISFRDSMDRLGLLSERAKAVISDEALHRILLGETRDQDPERLEALLAAMPQSQVDSRGTVHDPVDIIREPDALLRPPAGAGPRLLSAGGEAGVW